MRLGEIPLKRELVTAAALSEALERQKTNGGRLGANLIALGYLTEEQLCSVIHGAPAAPNGVSATGISARNLLSLLLKFMSADSGGSRPRIRDDVAHHSDLISLGVPR
jgi:hypothetical protein